MHENADAKKKLRLNYQCLLANQGLITLLKYCIAKNMEKKKRKEKKGASENKNTKTAEGPEAFISKSGGVLRSYQPLMNQS